MDTADLPGPHAATPAGKPRARALGIPFGGRPGHWNAITDVPGVQVGYIHADPPGRFGPAPGCIRDPPGRGLREGAADAVAAGFFSQKATGDDRRVLIEESGTLSLPIAITNTHAVGIAHAAIVA